MTALIFKLKHANTIARAILSLIAALALTASIVVAQQKDQDNVEARLQGFDSYMEQVMKDWNAPGIGIGIVMGDKLVFAKGYGFRDYGKKLPYTVTTTQPIASNTKLFTAVAVGLLVEEGKLRWDEPIKQFVPTIRFYNDELDRSVTIRDMLAHRTGVTRHDSIWYKSAFTRRELSRRSGPPALAAAPVPRQGVSGSCRLVHSRGRKSARDATTRSEW